MFQFNSLSYLQCSISMNIAGVYLIVGLSWDRQLMGTVASPEVCLYSQSRFLYSGDILTTSEVSQLFQRINNGNRSPYLTFTVQTADFLVVPLYLWLTWKGIWARSVPYCFPFMNGSGRALLALHHNNLHLHVLCEPYLLIVLKHPPHNTVFPIPYLK